MNVFENMLTKGSYRHCNCISRFCRPLFHLLGLTAFSYALITKEGKSFSLCTNPEHYERYYFDGIFKKDPCCNRSHSSLQPVNIWAGILNKDDPEQRSVYEQQIRDGMYNGICIKIDIDSGYETYDFATNNRDFSILNVLLSNLDLINIFIAEFKLKYSNIIKGNIDNYIYLPEFIGDEFYNSAGMMVSKSLTDDKGTAHSQAKHYIAVDGKNIVLTQREYDCLVCLLEGKTAKETGKRLCISYRTVEDYIDHVKDKTNSRNKLELLSKISKIIEV